ncbi:hypothetical protein JXB22_02725 [candidate division WOR-3 bacterium]|nr:hypothetical protein [candidate division WOR-3 bacterium]
MVLDSMEDLEKGPFCKPYGQLFYDNLEQMPSFQVIEAYLRCLFDALDGLQKAISILEGVLKKGANKLSEIKTPLDLQHLFGTITKSRGEVEKEIEHLSQNRRNIDDLIAHYSEIGLFTMPVKDFMALFDVDFRVKVEKKRTDSDELYETDISGQDLAGCAGAEHLNKVMTGYLLKKLMTKKE